MLWNLTCSVTLWKVLIGIVIIWVDEVGYLLSDGRLTIEYWNNWKKKVNNQEFGKWEECHWSKLTVYWENQDKRV